MINLHNLHELKKTYEHFRIKILYKTKKESNKPNSELKTNTIIIFFVIFYKEKSDLYDSNLLKPPYN